MISVTILTKNSEKYLEPVLNAVASFDDVLVFDTGSTDATCEIAARFPNVRIVKGAFTGFGPTHNRASALAKHDWILSIDSDEIVSSELADQIQGLALDPACVYSFWRKNFFQGKFIRGCGWYPDRQIRLYNRTATRFTDAAVHESIIRGSCREVALAGYVTHHPYDSISDFLKKMEVYSTLFAEQYAGKRRSFLLRAIGHGAWAFLRSYFLKRGLLLGAQGFIISAYNGHTAYYKYLKLQERNKKLAKK